LMASATNARKHLFFWACLGLAVAMPAISQTLRAIGDVVSTDASVNGAVLVIGANTRVMSGSSITAGNSTASLKLARGGEVLVCPHAKVSLTNSQSGRDLVFGMGTGAIEAHYTLASNADTILTPDFRILLAGPGTFHFAFGSDARGNTCVRSLDNDTASIIVTEQMGDGVYQVRPGEQAYFRGGTIAGVQKNVPPDCGCPPALPVAVANTALPAPPATEAIQLPSFGKPAQPSSGSGNVQAPVSPTRPATPQAELPANSPEAEIAQHGTAVAPPAATPPAAAPPPPAHEIHLQVDAPFVFRGDEVPPPPVVATLHLVQMPSEIMENVTVLPPPPPPPAAAQPAGGNVATPAPKPRKGVFGHIRSFFAAIFK
jgi:hypothetical protein